MKRGKEVYLYRVYQLLQSGKTLKEIGLEEFKFPKKTYKQRLNKLMFVLKEIKYVEKLSYGVWEIKKKWDNKEIDKFLKQVKKTRRIGTNQLEELKDLDEVRGHAFMGKLQIPKNYKNWENRRKILDLHNLKWEPHFIGGDDRGEDILIDGIKINLYNKNIVVNRRRIQSRRSRHYSDLKISN